MSHIKLPKYVNVFLKTNQKIKMTTNFFQWDKNVLIIREKKNLKLKKKFFKKQIKINKGKKEKKNY